MENKPLILLVDDQMQNLELLEAFLCPCGYEVTMACSGEEAMKRLSRNSIDLILLDVRMPGIDGFEVCRRIRADEAHRRIPIIMVTAMQDTEDRQMGKKAGCDDFISKPVVKADLLLRVRALLSLYR